jgi:tRNA/rRNA methyltransferase
MANFGLQDLVVVAPYEPVWQDARSAPGAEEVLRSARALPSLREGVGDCTLVVGTTAGSRRNLDRDLLPLSDLSAWLRERKVRGRAAILFGSEKTGLSNEHLSYCHVLVRIPTVMGCPSMNLGQAVAVCAYELARAGAVTSRLPRLTVHHSGPANLQSLDHLFARAVCVLEQVGYLKPKSRNAMLRKLRRLLLDLELTNHDARILGAVLAQIEWGLALKPEVRSGESE